MNGSIINFVETPKEVGVDISSKKAKLSSRSFALIKNSSITLHSEKGKTLSVFAYGGIAEGISIKGAVYETDNLTLTPFFPLGVSNKFKENTATVGVKNGCVLIKW